MGEFWPKYERGGNDRIKASDNDVTMNSYHMSTKLDNANIYRKPSKGKYQ